jgi:hypothetical protein
LNPRPTDYESVALPTELQQHAGQFIPVEILVWQACDGKLNRFCGKVLLIGVVNTNMSMSTLHAIENQMARSNARIWQQPRKSAKSFTDHARLGFLYLVEKENFTAPHMASSHTTLQWLGGKQRL